MLTCMLYAAKCYWPGVTQADLQQVAERARAGPGTRSGSVSYLGSLLFTADDLVLCLLQGPSRAEVIQASEWLGIPCERLMEPVWPPPDRPIPEGAAMTKRSDRRTTTSPYRHRTGSRV